jgi:hypothetical protein
VWRAIYDQLKAELRRRAAAPTGRLVTEAAQALAGQGPELAKAAEAQHLEQRAEVALAKRKKTTESREAGITEGGYVEQAEALLAQIRHQGGVHGGGRIQRMTAEQHEPYVEEQLERYLHRQIGLDQRGQPVYANPELGGEATGLLATHIASWATQQYGQRIATMSQQMGAAQAAAAASEQTSAIVAQLAKRVSGVEDQARRTRSNNH